MACMLSIYVIVSSCDTFGCFFFFQAEDGIRDAQESRGLGDVYKRQEGGSGEIIADAIADSSLPTRASKDRANTQSFIWLPAPLLKTDFGVFVAGYLKVQLRRKFTSLLRTSPSSSTTPTPAIIQEYLHKALAACEDDLRNKGLVDTVFTHIVSSTNTVVGWGASLSRADIGKSPTGLWLTPPNVLHSATRHILTPTTTTSSSSPSSHLSVVFSSVREYLRTQNVTTPELKLRMGERGWSCAAVCSGRRESMLTLFQERLEVAVEEVTGWVDAAISLLEGRTGTKTSSTTPSGIATTLDSRRY
eukprot:TRINITY_DN12271_c0_g1_i1.p1 TRINITY_DN12271_c0_g1~~TRINITY_DN12271_c0_g1_i1.p1  ORF type:complete len:303 (+),score=47.85 TRINITY_DN12271_c0_g1_i1:3-911(+)